MDVTRHWLGIGTCLASAACGSSDPVNMREEFGKGMQRLGVVAFYPLRESARLGQLYLVDTSTVKTAGPAFVPTNVVLSNAAVPFMEAHRAERMAPLNRFPCSSEKLGAQLLSGHTPSYYQQPDCSPLAVPDSSKAGATTAVAAGTSITFNVNPAGITTPVLPAQGKAQPAKLQPAKPQPTSLAALEMAGIPSYSLATVENFTAAGSVPTAFASFLAAIGFSHSTSLQVRAEGVEIAGLSSEEFALGIRRACAAEGNPFSDPSLARATLGFADGEMRDNARTRAKLASDAAIRDAYIASEGTTYPYQPKVYMLRQVYYLRGIRYIFNDTRAAVAMAEAAVSARLPEGQQAPSLPNISMNVVTPAPSTSAQTGPSANLAAEVATLRAQVDQLRGAVASNTNIQLGATYTRATARGMEMVDLFQRPLAFGYVPIAINLDISNGLEDFCRLARGEAPLSRSEKGAGR